jgi:predicted helicase
MRRLAVGTAQCFGLYTYSDEDGNQRAENITDWALAEFRDHYGDRAISKRDVFNYVYAILHHPLYRERFAENLQKEIPRLPLPKDFQCCAGIGSRLVDVHVGYESAKPFELQWLENPTEPLSYRVTGRMRVNKDAGTIQVNGSLTLAGIPQDAFNYVLGTRSGLEWVVDQYRCEIDDDGTVTSDPNDPHNERYIVELIGRVTTVSLETLALVRQLPADLDFVAPNEGRKRTLKM